jgi:hypothetical protein
MTVNMKIELYKIVVDAFGMVGPKKLLVRRE